MNRKKLKELYQTITFISFFKSFNRGNKNVIPLFRNLNMREQSNYEEILIPLYSSENWDKLEEI